MNDLHSLLPPYPASSEGTPYRIVDNAPLLIRQAGYHCRPRHIRGPFAETRDLRTFADKTRPLITNIIPSQMELNAITNNWVKEVGRAGRITVLRDSDREIYRHSLSISRRPGE